MIRFIDEHRKEHGVEPICRVLPIAPSKYHDHAAKRRDPSRMSKRAKQDEELKIKVKQVFEKLIEQLLFRQSPNRQSAQDERTRTETQILILLFATDTDKFDPSRLLELLSRDDEFRLLIAQQLAKRSQVSSGARSRGRRQ